MTTITMFRDARDAVTYQPGQVVFTEGEAGSTMYVVIEGEVEIRIGGKPVRTIGPGSIFGEMALIAQGPRSGTATARVATRLVVIDERRFNFLVQQTPFFALQVMRIICERLKVQDAEREAPGRS